MARWSVCIIARSPGDGVGIAARSAERARFIAPWPLNSLSRVQGAQLVKGEDFALLAPTVSMHLLGHTRFKPRAEGPEHTTWVKSREMRRGRPVSADRVGVFVELPKLTLGGEGLATPAEKWLYFLTHGHSLNPAEVHAMGMELLDEADQKLRNVSRGDDLRFAGLAEAIRCMDAVTNRHDKCSRSRRRNAAPEASSTLDDSARRRHSGSPPLGDCL